MRFDFLRQTLLLSALALAFGAAQAASQAPVAAENGMVVTPSTWPRASVSTC